MVNIWSLSDETSDVGGEQLDGVRDFRVRVPSLPLYPPPVEQRTRVHTGRACARVPHARTAAAARFTSAIPLKNGGPAGTFSPLSSADLRGNRRATIDNTSGALRAPIAFARHSAVARREPQCPASTKRASFFARSLSGECHTDVLLRAARADAARRRRRRLNLFFTSAGEDDKFT